MTDCISLAHSVCRDLSLFHDTRASPGQPGFVPKLSALRFRAARVIVGLKVIWTNRAMPANSGLAGFK